MAFKFELHAALSLVGFQNNNRPFPVRERTFGELANGLCEWPVVVLIAPCEVIRNPESNFFWFRYPESGVLESGIQTVESGIQITEESGIQSPGRSGIYCFINLEKNIFVVNIFVRISPDPNNFTLRKLSRATRPTWPPVQQSKVLRVREVGRETITKGARK
jgi:hypothetical protein